MNGVYLQALQTYTRALAERNALLKKGGAVGAQLEAFEKVLAPAAAELIAQRTAGLNQLGASVAEAYGRLCDAGEKAALIYEPDVAEASAGLREVAVANANADANATTSSSASASAASASSSSTPRQLQLALSPAAARVTELEGKLRACEATLDGDSARQRLYELLEERTQ